MTSLTKVPGRSWEISNGPHLLCFTAGTAENNNAEFSWSINGVASFNCHVERADLEQLRAALAKELPRGRAVLVATPEVQIEYSTKMEAHSLALFLKQKQQLPRSIYLDHATGVSLKQHIEQYFELARIIETTVDLQEANFGLAK